MWQRLLFTKFGPLIAAGWLGKKATEKYIDYVRNKTGGKSLVSKTEIDNLRFKGSK